MKVIILTLVAALIVGGCSADKLRKASKSVSLEERSSTEDKSTDISDADKKDKEVHKRGVFHYGTLAAHTSWPKAYAAHYGYGLHAPVSTYSVSPLSASHIHVPGTLKYNTGFHYKTLATVPAVSSPTLSTLSAVVPHVHAHASTATPFIIRPGGAVVQSYSVNYPHHKQAVSIKPVPTYASVAHPVQPVQHVQPLQHVQPVQHVQHVQPVHAIQSVPVQPVQSVLQVQHVKPFVNYETPTPQFPSYFQTVFQTPSVPATAVHIPSQVHASIPLNPSQPALPAFPAFPPAPAVPVAPQVPEILTPAQPAFPAIPSFHNPPAFPAIPATPSVPVVPNVPALPSIPTISHNSQPQFPNSGFFPVNVQPPLPQQPPTFVNFNPTAQVPGLVPVAGTPNQNNPDFGSAEGAPQIPVHPTPEAHPEPELPQPTQQPWKPVLYQPPNVDNDVNRPSNTLLPPYGNSPAEGKKSFIIYH